MADDLLMRLLSHPLGIAGVAAAGAALVAAAVAARWRHDRQEAELLEGLAERFHGEVAPGGLFDGPGLRLGLAQGRIPVSLRFGSRRKNRRPRHGSRLVFFTEFHAGVDPGGLELSLGPEDLLSKGFALLGAPDLQTGDAAFDRRYGVWSNDWDKARAVLGYPGVREGVVKVQALAPEAAMEVSLNGSGLNVLLEQRLWDPPRAAAFLEGCAQLTQLLDELFAG